MRIGVVTPAFNVAGFVGDAIRSVMAQRHTDWCMVVVDDGSTDTTAAIVESFDHPRLRLIRQGHAGVSAARNRGLAALDAEAYLFLDADDCLAPEALGELAATLDASPWATAAVGPYRFAAGSGPARRVRHPAHGNLLVPLLRRNRFVNGGHVLVCAEAAQAAGPFDTGLRYGEDWEYWVRIALQGEFVAVRTAVPLLHVRQRPDGAYARLAADPAAFRPCMAKIFDNPAVAARVGTDRLAVLRRQAEAEGQWVVGRELIRHGRPAEGLGWLRRAVRLSPSLRRMALLAAAPAVLRLPAGLRGALRPYAAVSVAPLAVGGQPGPAIAGPG